MNPIDNYKIIQNVLDKRDPVTIENREARYREASVLIPFLWDHDEFKILFTKRTHRVEQHKGQISFPGGGVEEHDGTFLDTALRETYEEVGISPADVTVLGRIDDALTLASDFLVHPYVGRIPYPYEFVRSEIEVKSILLVPLRVFMPDSPTARTRDWVVYDEITYESSTYRYDGEVIWGATARVMRNLVEILNGKMDLIVKDH